jgi:rfaE bifunctional protein kinase chain/domain
VNTLDRKRLRAILSRFSDLRIGVVGDFFLDSYYDCDPDLDEVSLETGKKCYQVIRTRRQAGAAGTVAANLKALGVGAVEAVGFCGDDGEGYELRRAMAALGLDMSGFFTCADRFTPTYNKPCYLDPSRGPKSVSEELQRIDLKNRRPTPVSLQERIIAFVRRRCAAWNGVLMLDQVQEANRGVLTSRVRTALIAQARRRPELVALADSRTRIQLFRQVIGKPNKLEAARALGATGKRVSLSASSMHAKRLSHLSGQPVFLTMGERGILVADAGELVHIPARTVRGPIDSVGAGDATSAALAAALAAGACLEEAGAIAAVAAAITVGQIGTTGTATQKQILRYFSA